MKKYARIKEYKGKLENYLTDGKWYEIIEDASQPDPNSTYFKLVHGLAVYDNSANSNHLVGGSWEIVEGTEIPYGIVGCIGVTKCKFVDGNTVGCWECDYCKYHIKDDQVNQIVTCGYPQNKEKSMTGYEALAKAKNGETICCEHDVLSFTKTDELIGADSGSGVWSSSLSDGGWYIKGAKIEVTIDGETFNISKESAKSFKESINNLKL